MAVLGFEIGGGFNNIMSQLPIWGVVGAIVLFVILILGLVGYWWWRKRQFAEYNVLCPIFEPTQNGVSLRTLDWGRRIQTAQGEEWEFWSERPPVPVQPIDAEHFSSWSDKIYSRFSHLLKHELPDGSRFAVEQAQPNRVVFGKPVFGIAQFILINNQYIPFSYSIDNILSGELRVLKVPDLKVFLDEQRKLQLRHLVRNNQLMQILPYILSGVLVIVVLIALGIFAWMHHKDTALMNDILAVSKQSLEVAAQQSTQFVDASQP